MKHVKTLTFLRPLRAELCAAFPVTPEGLRAAELKDILGWEQQPTDRIGVIMMCK